MPKQVWKIERFDGGLNSNSDARDIDDTELSETENIMVDSLEDVPRCMRIILGNDKIRVVDMTASVRAGGHRTSMNFESLNSAFRFPQNFCHSGLLA